MATKKQLKEIEDKLMQDQQMLELARRAYVKALGEHAVNPRNPNVDIRIKETEEILEKLHTKH